jgi:predicted MFS family arabinose efflux permease
MTGMSGVGGLTDWQWLFIIEGAPSMAMGVFVLFRLPDGPADAAWLDEDAKRIVMRALEAERAQSDAHQSLMSAVKSPRVWLCTLVFFCLVAGNATLAFWVPSVIKALGVKSVFDIGLLSALPFLTGTIVMIVNAAHSDARQERRLHCGIPAIVAGAGLFGTGYFMDHGVVAFISLMVAAGGVLGAMPVFWSIPAAFLRGKASAGGIAVINCFANLAGFVAPWIIGLLTTRTGKLSSGLFFAAALEGLAALLVLFVVGANRSRGSIDERSRIEAAG